MSEIEISKLICIYSSNLYKPVTLTPEQWHIVRVVQKQLEDIRKDECSRVYFPKVRAIKMIRKMYPHFDLKEAKVLIEAATIANNRTEEEKFLD